MKRLTSDNIFEMNMHQLALNQVYIGEGGWTQYVEGPDCERSVCDLVRAVLETLGVERRLYRMADREDARNSG